MLMAAELAGVSLPNAKRRQVPMVKSAGNMPKNHFELATVRCALAAATGASRGLR
jgi:acid phosphatase family membrane protein YuiD